MTKIQLKNKKNTKVVSNPSSHLQVFYYDTCIIHHDKIKDSLHISNGGFYTASTKRHINQYMAENNIDIQIIQKNFEWIVSVKGEKIPFVDGMIINL